MPRRFGERSGQPSTSASAGFGDVKRELRDSWTAKHRNVMTKLVVEGGWVQKRVYDIGWSEDMRRESGKEEGTEKHRLFFSRVEGGQTPDAGCGEEMGAQGPNVGRHFGTCLREDWSSELPCFGRRRRCGQEEQSHA